jgi:hypothetical protein
MLKKNLNKSNFGMLAYRRLQLVYKFGLLSIDHIESFLADSTRFLIRKACHDSF